MIQSNIYRDEKRQPGITPEKERPDTGPGTGPNQEGRRPSVDNPCCTGAQKMLDGYQVTVLNLQELQDNLT